MAKKSPGDSRGGRRKQPNDPPTRSSTPPAKTEDADHDAGPQEFARWRRFASVTISIEEFCKEVAHLSAKFPADKRIAPTHRNKAAKHVRRVAQHGKVVLEALRDWLANLEVRPADSPRRRLEALWRRLQGVDLGERLHTIITQLGNIGDNLEGQYSRERMERINEDFAAMAHKVSSVTIKATEVRASLKVILNAVTMPPDITLRMHDLIQAITNAISTSVTDAAETFPEYASFSARMPSRIDRIRIWKKAYADLRQTLQKQLVLFAKGLYDCDESMIGRVEEFMETLDSVLITVRSTEEFAVMTENAASQGIDGTIRVSTEDVASEMKALRHEFQMLDELFWKYREIVARAPFKRVASKTTQPPWGNLSEWERRVIMVLVVLRSDSPDAEMYAVSRKDLEQRLELPDNDANLNRVLIRLDEEHEIVGKYQPIRSIDAQQPAYGYWIEEYAYAHYGPQVLGDAWVPPAVS